MKFTIKMLLAAVLAMSLAGAAAAESRMETLEKSMFAVANKLTQGKPHKDQDIELIENVMEGDETVYQRIWTDDKFIVIRNYKDDKWSRGGSYIALFWTNDPDITFASGLRVGSSLKDIRDFYGQEADELQFDDEASPTECRAYSDGYYASILFELKDGTVKSVSYTASDLTKKMYGHVRGRVPGLEGYEEESSGSVAQGGTEINEKNFPDEKFRAFVQDTIDIDMNDILSTEEITAAEMMNVDKKGIADLSGIEFFTELKVLSCNFNHLEKLDVRKNTQLVGLLCGGNRLTELDVSKNTALENLFCPYNQIIDLDVSKNTALEELNCSGNQLADLYARMNAELKKLDCSGNQLAELDIGKNRELKELNCAGNQLEDLDLGSNTMLEILDCSSNRLTKLDISSNMSLKALNCLNNSITKLPTFNNSELQYLFVDKDVKLNTSRNRADMQVRHERPKIYRTGDIIILGRYEQDNDTSNGAEPIEWIVIEEGTTPTLITRYCIDAAVFHDDDKGVAWDKSAMRRRLNEDFLNSAFSAEEREAIFTSGRSTADNKKYGTSGGENTRDTVFLCSLEGAREIYMHSDAERRTERTPYARAKMGGGDEYFWWLRSPGADSSLTSAVNADGSVSDYGFTNHGRVGGIRPAIVIDTSKISPAVTGSVKH